ncbi:long-chain-fatty-acid--CoA ligase [Altererythrobacter sp. TH136]|uniref:long-chain-fatty-acid--CoA ligase n=1 Tax=Altererythrobacter sp. TH136 TaxID=2067415 RepID=UPI001163890D|nr:long-chain-fatty-acid--CoA ligase [Altererythrobacter sp. TH136]QDM40794.1 long-chain-fatty-acid--CoA ligase [Altererythrobacter sp. TH136]
MQRPTLPETFGAALAEHARLRPNDEALVFGTRVTNYATFEEHAKQIANGLAELGLKPGDRVAYVGKNSDYAIELAFGVAKAGMVFVPVIWRLATPEVAWILADAAPGAVFLEPEFETCAPPGVTSIIIDEASGDGESFVAWRDRQSSTPPEVTVDEHDVVLQLYTSGTTGKPKGVLLTHANGIRQRANQIASGVTYLLAEPGDTTIIAMPYGHIGGVGGVFLAVNAGQTLIIQREFEPGAVIEAIRQYQIKRMFLVPAALGMMLQHPAAENADFSSLVTFTYGASPIPLDLLKQGVERMGCEFVQVYGMTETWGSVVALPPEDHRPDRVHKMSAAGKALPGVELRILSPELEDLPANTVGEVAIRSPNVMAGYWKRPLESGLALIGDGWLRTGDAGLLDDEGYLFIQDRMKDMIITGAENVYPAEVESALYGHPHVLDVAVIGIPDPRWGEAIKAIVVPVPGVEPDVASIVAHARERIAGFKCPKSIDFVDTLPRNPSGKILRRALREPYWAGYARNVN